MGVPYQARMSGGGVPTNVEEVQALLVSAAESHAGTLAKLAEAGVQMTEIRDNSNELVGVVARPTIVSADAVMRIQAATNQLSRMTSELEAIIRILNEIPDA